MTSATPDTAAPARSRLLGLDGLRGIAIVLVLLSHTWVVTEMPDKGAGRVLMTSGNYAVAFFFAVGGFLATRALLREVETRHQARPAMFFLRRWIRISGQVYPLVIFVLVLTAIDKNMNAYKINDTRASAWHILTYTWNGYIAEQSMLARPDLGHLWYVCTDIWVVGFIALAVFILRGRRVPLFAVFVLAALAVYVMRRDVYVTHGEAHALIRIHTRADGLLWGAASAVALPWCTRFREYGREIGLAMMVALLPLMWAVNGTDYFSIWTPVLCVVLGVLVIAIAQGQLPLWLGPILTNRVAVRLGEYSFALYVWHYPVFWYIARNYTEWSNTHKVIVSYAATALLALVVQRLIERPLVTWLASPGWAVFNAGLLPGLRDLVMSRVRGTDAVALRSPGRASAAIAHDDALELHVEDIAAEVDSADAAEPPRK